MERIRTAAAVVSNDRLRAIGQKDLLHGRAHVWVQNVAHSWLNVVQGVEASAESGELRLSGFLAGQRFSLDWWDPYAVAPAQQIVRSELIVSGADGVIRIEIRDLTRDIAFQLAPAVDAAAIRLFYPVLVGEY